MHQIVPYPVHFANRPDVLVASTNSLSVGVVQEALKGCVAVKFCNDHFGGNLYLKTSASEQSQEQHDKNCQVPKKLMYPQRNLARFMKIVRKSVT